MTKKPRSHPRLMERPSQKRRKEPRHAPIEEFRTCTAPEGCHNIISIRERPGYSGPIFCSIHSHLREKT